MERLQEQTKSLAPIGEIRDTLFSLKGDITEYVNKDGHDLMHCAIAYNHPQVAALLYTHKQWPSFGHTYCEKKATIPYLHFAAKLGRAPILNIILENKPEELSLKCHRNEILGTTQERVTFVIEVSPEQKLKEFTVQLPPKLSALDIAAIHKQHNCVQNLLLAYRDKNEATPLAKTAKVNNQLALLYLLESSPTLSEWEAAFNMAVRHKHPECLDILLTQNSQYREWHFGVNPFHIMYCQSSGFPSYSDGVKNQSHIYANLAECSKVLLAHKINPATPTKSLGFYALHSLLESMASDVEWTYSLRQLEENLQHQLSLSTESQIPEHHLKTLKILLEAGLSPNYDEYMHVNEMQLGQEALSVDESNRSCALDMLFNRGRYLCGEQTACVAELFFQHGASQNAARKGLLSPISLFIQRLYISFSEDIDLYFWKDVAEVLLLYGSDPDEAVDLISKFFSMWLSFKVTIKKKYLHPLCYFYAFCSYEAGQTLKENFEEDTQDMPAEVSDEILKDVRQTWNDVYTLQFLCKKQIWSSIGRDKKLLDQLCLPPGLVTSILAMFRI